MPLSIYKFCGNPHYESHTLLKSVNEILPFIFYNFLAFNPLNTELNPICYLLALLGAHHFSSISAGERPQAAHLLRSWVRIPLGAWIFVCCECRVLSGRGLCDELITRPEESYRLVRRCVWYRNIKNRCSIYIYIYDISNLRVNTSGHCSGHKQVKG